MNSREKGKRGERQWRDELRANGYCARRGQQFSGSPESPDVVCDDLPWIHFEVKAVEKLNIEVAMEQGRADAARETSKSNIHHPKIPVVAHRRSFRPWLVTMEAEAFFKFLRGDFTEANEANKATEEDRNSTGVNGESRERPDFLTAKDAKNAKGEKDFRDAGTEVRPPIASLPTKQQKQKNKTSNETYENQSK